MATKIKDKPRNVRRSVVSSEDVFLKADAILAKKNTTLSTFCHDALKKLIEENKK